MYNLYETYFSFIDFSNVLKFFVTVEEQQNDKKKHIEIGACLRIGNVNEPYHSNLIHELLNPYSRQR